MSLTQEELDDWFKAFDSDGSGKIDVNELRQVVKAFYELQEKTATDAEIDADVGAILAATDTSGDGKIDKSEFFKFFNSA